MLTERRTENSNQVKQDQGVSRKQYGGLLKDMQYSSIATTKGTRPKENASGHDVDSRLRTFVKEVLSSVTGGKLKLVESRDDLPTKLQPVGRPITLDHAGCLRELRLLVQEAARELSFSESRLFDLLIASGEGAMNAVVHGVRGNVTVCTDRLGRIQVWIVDHGKGIPTEMLPKATLARGFSTAGSMGQGFKMILQTADSVWLLTGPNGTTVVIEQNRTEQSGLDRYDALLM